MISVFFHPPPPLHLPLFLISHVSIHISQSGLISHQVTDAEYPKQVRRYLCDDRPVFPCVLLIRVESHATSGSNDQCNGHSWLRRTCVTSLSVVSGGLATGRETTNIHSRLCHLANQITRCASGHGFWTRVNRGVCEGGQRGCVCVLREGYTRERGVQWSVIEVGDSSPELCGRSKRESGHCFAVWADRDMSKGGGRDVSVGEGYTVCVWGREREREEFCLITDGLMNLAYFAVSRGFGGHRRGWLWRDSALENRYYVRSLQNFDFENRYYIVSIHIVEVLFRG